MSAKKMKTTIMERKPHDSLPFSRKFFNLKKKPIEDRKEEPIESISTFNPTTIITKVFKSLSFTSTKPTSKTLIGTILGQRPRGHVTLMFQEHFKANPSFVVQLATPTSMLVNEMACGLVRIALQCDKTSEKRDGLKLLDEPSWRVHCNGRKCGYGVRRECGVEEWDVLNSLDRISFGAGVMLPGEVRAGEVVYVRAKFERVVGGRDSEAFYMVSPDRQRHAHGGLPELCVYLLRV